MEYKLKPLPAIVAAVYPQIIYPMRREVSWEILHQIVSVFCKLQLPLIKPSLHFLTLSNQLVSKIIPLLRTCNCFVGKLNLSKCLIQINEIDRNVASVRSGHCYV